MVPPPAVVVQVGSTWAPPAHMPQSVPPVAPAAPPVAVEPAGPLNRHLPADDWIRRSFAATRRVPLVLGDHVHNTDCAEQGCALLGQSAHEPGAKAYGLAVLAVLVGLLLVWPLQYTVVTPLIGLRYATSNSTNRGWGVAGVVFGLGVFMSLAYLAMPQVPRPALTPWGVYRGSMPTGAS